VAGRWRRSDWERSLATLGEDFHISRLISRTACAAMLRRDDGALALKERMGLAAAEIGACGRSYRATLEVAGSQSATGPRRA